MLYGNTTQGYETVKTCQKFSHIIVEAMHQLTSLSQSRSPELSLACSRAAPPYPSLAVLLFFSISLPSQWVLTACLNNSDSSNARLC